MNNEEKKNLEHIKKRANYVKENILGTNIFTTYDVHCVNMLIEIIEKQQPLLCVELNAEDEDGYKATGYFRINYCPMCR